jgi:hypothetical protein
MRWLLAVAICIGAVSEASAAISYRAGLSTRHLAARPMGLDIVPDSVVRFLWQHWFDNRLHGVGNKEWLRMCRRCWAYPAEEETK